MPDSGTPRAISFGPFRFDPAEGFLRRGSEELALSPKALGTLKCLLERPGKVVSKQALIDRVWDGAAVTDRSLNEAVRLVRQALGDDPQQPTYIQTVHRRGYRFIAPVTVEMDAPAAIPSQAAELSGRALGSESLVSEPGSARSKASVWSLTHPLTLRDWILFVLLAGLIAWALTGGRIENPRRAQDSPFPQRFVETLPPDNPLYWARGVAVAVSPDGNRVVYVGKQGNDSRLFLRRLDELDWTLLPGTEGAYEPVFSPDGNWIAFMTRRLEWSQEVALWKIPVHGGSPLLLCELTTSAYPIWGRDGYIYFTVPWGGTTRRIARIPEAGGRPELMQQLEPEGSRRTSPLQFLPDGQTFLYVAAGRPGELRQVGLLSLNDGEDSILLEGVDFALYVPTGHLVYQRSGGSIGTGNSLWARTLDVSTRELGEPEVQILQGYTDFNFSESGGGTLVYFESDPDAGPNLVWMNKSGELSKIMEAPSADCRHPSLSPDGRTLAMQCKKRPESTYDIYLFHLSRRTFTPLRSEEDSFAPIWTRDGSRITYSAKQGNVWRIYLAPYDGYDGVGPAELLVERDHPIFPQSWSPDGGVLAFLERHPDTGEDIWLLPMDGQEEPEPYFRSSSHESGASFSPDGKWLAYHSNLSGDWHTYVVSNPGAEIKAKVSSWPGGWPVWSPDGGKLFYLTSAGEAMVVVERADEAGFAQQSPRLLFNAENRLVRSRLGRVFDISPDGQRFIALDTGGPLTASKLHIVVNWFEELKQRVPTGR